MGMDWEIYDDVSVAGGHFIHNQTVAATSAISAKGCNSATAVTKREQQRAGFWFDIALNFGAVWNNGNTCVPTYQAGINQYATEALAKAAPAVVKDVLIKWYADANGSRVHHACGMADAIPVTVLGGLPDCGVICVPSIGDAANWAGDLTAQNAQVKMRNFTWIGPGSVCIYAPTPGNSGSGVSVERVLSLGGLVLLNPRANTTANSCQAINCIQIGGTHAVLGVVAFRAYNVTAFFCITAGFDAGAAASTLTNCAALFCLAAAGFLNMGGATLTTCASTDATGGGLINLTDAALKLWMSILGGILPAGGITGTSVLYRAGTTVGAVVYDMQGLVRGSIPSIGAIEVGKGEYTLEQGALTFFDGITPLFSTKQR
jgi:hypothetical protein